METVARVCHEILRLPSYHCELNLIELAWAAEKNYVAGENKDMSLGLLVQWRNCSGKRRKNCLKTFGENALSMLKT